MHETTFLFDFVKLKKLIWDFLMFIDFLVHINIFFKAKNFGKKNQFSWISFIILIILRSLTSIRVWLQNLKQGKVGRSLKERNLVVDLEERKWKNKTTKEKGLRIKLTIAQ